jgi:hypothetical protein
MVEKERPGHTSERRRMPRHAMGAGAWDAIVSEA